MEQYLAATGRGHGHGGSVVDQEDRELAKAERLEKLLHKRAQREIEEIKRDKLRGDLVHLKDVQVETSANYALIRDVVVSIPDRLMQVVPDDLRPTVRSELQQVIHGILKQLAQLGRNEAT